MAEIESGDPLFINKIVGAILTAGLIAMATGFLASVVFQNEPNGEFAYIIEVPEDTAAVAEVAAPAGPEPILALLAAADAAAGGKTAKKCAACHTFNDGGANKTGPNLFGIVGRPVASVDTFKYSDTMKGLGGEWDYASLNAFLFKPKAYAPGTKMSFGGLKKVGDRANLVAYLRGLSASPAPLP